MEPLIAYAALAISGQVVASAENKRAYFFIEEIFMNQYYCLFVLALAAFIFASAPELASASVESSLQAVQDKLVGTILPLAVILGFVFAGFSYIAGNPNARSHLVLAIIGAGVGFGASSIVSFIRALVH